MPGHPFYGSQAWKRTRREALERAGYRCERCGADVSARGASRVDHVVTRLEAPERALDPSNVRVLCTVCDARRHSEKGGRSIARADLAAVGADGIPTHPA